MPKISSVLRDAVARCASWENFVRHLSKKPEKEKGDIFEHLVRAYLQLDPEYATKLRKVWLLNDVPSALRKKLKLPDDDQGIDLIAETNTGEYWAIQCKYREDTARPLPWREISTFTGLAFGVCKNISFGLVCTTTERITRVLTHQDRIGFCSLDVWQGLDKEFFDRLRKLLGHQPAKLVPLKPRPHQKKAIADARKHFVGKKQKRGKLISPCGSGKSLTAYWIARDLKAKKIVVAVPSLALIRQTLKVWLRESLANGDTVEWICVCSDESAGRVEQDDVAVLRQDLGVPCLTDPKGIASWLKKKKPGLTVVFTTYQSGEALGKAARRARFSFDLGVMDEAHKTVGDGDKLFSHLLHDKNLPIRRRIFMTATERRYRGKGDKILSMDNAAVYGDTFHLLSFKQALEQKPAILSDYRIVTILVSREEVADLIRENVFVKPDKGRWNKDIEAEMLASLVALRKAMRKYPIKHAVSFHSSIQRAEFFKDHNEAYNHAFKKHGTIETFHVSGKTPTGTRARIVSEFAATDRGLITNARCLTEGVDVPDIDCVMFADPRRSAVDIVQAVGRALRPAKGKKMGYVIVPILHKAKAKPGEIFKSEEFQEILGTLRALASNDERIIEYFRAISKGKRRNGGGSVVFDIDEKLAKRIKLEQFAQDIELRCWSRLARLSWRPFEEARAFARSLGLVSGAEWANFTKGKMPHKGGMPSDIPASPMPVYADKGWISMGDWLGTGFIAPRLREYRTFTEARKFARGLGLKTHKEWNKFCRGQLPRIGRLPADVSASPESTYAGKGWSGIGDWLGTGAVASQFRRYRSFRQARKFARSLGLNSGKDWQAFCRGELIEKGKLPADIPAAPNNTYAEKGWAGMGDWLGTGFVSPALRRYRSFKSARAFVRGLNLKNESEWRLFRGGLLPKKGKIPADIPSNPHTIYTGKGWAGLGDWLGTGTVATFLRQYRSFERARKFVRSLNLKNGDEWRAFCASHLQKKGFLPPDIPASPNNTYAEKGWAGMGDWLGTGNISNQNREFRSFQSARSFVRNLRLKNQREWSVFCKGHLQAKGKLPVDIPACPARVYAKKGWAGMGDWLGTGIIAPHLRRYRAFASARAFARRLGLSGQTEWNSFATGHIPSKGTLPKDVPGAPWVVYRVDGWVNMGDWLGTGSIAPRSRQYRPFQEARAFARKLNLKNSAEWHDFCAGRLPDKGRLPSAIPSNPDKNYAEKGWAGMGDWLGTGNISHSNRKFRSFQRARGFVRNLRLKNNEEWIAFTQGRLPSKGNLPADIPVSPARTYADKGWAGVGDWLGTGAASNRNRNYRPFLKARAFVRALGLKNQKEWNKFCKGDLAEKGKLPPDIPSKPARSYAGKGWQGFGDWLGNGNVARFSRPFRKFREARSFAHSLGLTSGLQWTAFCKGLLSEKGTRPTDIPINPDIAYGKSSWVSWADWLGTDRKRKATRRR